MGTTIASFYITGGTVPPGTPSYVGRQADRELFEGLSRGEFCYVLHARQMGKSSLMAHATARLREAGIAVVNLDLTRLGQNLTVEQWYDGLLGHLGRQLDLEGELEAYWLGHERLSPLQRWLGALHDVVLARVPGPLVIAVDEIDTVRSLAFSTDEFFAAIRDCYNRRSQDPEFGRLTFCLLGVATPSDLIADTRTTPFNIGKRIELTDFTAAEAWPLAAGLGSDAKTNQAVLERALYWTAGHPYLTQRLCQALAQDPDPTSAVDRLCAELFLSPGAQEKDDNLLFVRERLLNSEADRAALLDLYGQVQVGKRLGLVDTNPLVDLLRLSGVVRAESGRLAVRNRIYAQVFDRAWVITHMPDAELRRQKAAYRRGLVRATAIGATVAAVTLSLAVLAFTQRRRAEEQLVQINVSSGMRLANEGDMLGALPWLAEAVRLDTGRPQQQIDRLRFAATLSRAPKLLRLWWVGRSVEEAQFSPDRSRAAFFNQPDTTNDLHKGAAARVGIVEMVTGRVLDLAQKPGVNATDFAFSPDSGRLAVRYDDQTVRVWNARTGAPAAPLFRAGPAPSPGWNSRLDLPVGSVLFSPDGGRLVTASTDGTVRLWDAANGRPLIAPLPGCQAVGAVQFSPDGRRLVTANRDETARVWDTTTGRLLAVIHAGSAVHFVAFSPDGRHVLTMSEAGLRVWEAGTGKAGGPLIPRPLEDNKGGQTGLVTPRPSFSPDGRWILDSDRGQVWDFKTGGLVSYPKQQGLAVTNGWFSPEGRRFVTTATDFTVRVWDAASGTATLPPLKHAVAVVQAAFAPDGHRLLTFCQDGTVREWETAAAAPRDVVLQHGDPAFVYRGYLEAFSPDSRRVVTGSDDQTAEVWDAATGRPITPPLRHDGAMGAAVFSPDGRRVATASGDGVARIWDAASGKLVARTPPAGGFVYDVEFSPDGRRIVTAAGGSVRAVFSPDGRRIVSTGDGPSRVWDARTGRPIALCLSPAGGKNAAAFIWDPVSGRLLAPPLQHQGMACDAEFSPDGRRVVTASYDWTARVWDAATGKPITPLLRHADMGTWASFSPDGRRVATASADGTARVWDAGTGRPITSPLPHYRAVHVAVFSPDGRAVATAAEDGAARLWDAATGQPITPPLPSARGDSGGMNMLTNVAFSPDGRRLLTAGTDGTTHIWTLISDQRAPADLSRLAQLLTGSRIDASGGVVPLAPVTLVRAWQALHARYPGDFATTASEVLAWHRQVAGLCERAQRWDEVAQHVTPLITAEPWNEELRVRRARAAARAGESVKLPRPDRLAWHRREAETSETAGQWKIALVHLSALIDADPADGALRGRRARAYAALGQPRPAVADYLIALRAEPHHGADAWYSQALGLAAGVTNGKVRLSWQTLPLARGYEIYRESEGQAFRGLGVQAAPGPERLNTRTAEHPLPLVRLTGQPVAGTSFIDRPGGLESGRTVTYAVAPVFRGTAGQAIKGPRVRLPVMTVAGLPAWLGSSINEGERSGAARFQPATGEITLRGSGHDIWGKSDGFYLLSQPMRGDFRVTVKAISRPAATQEWALAGLMLRESLNAGARNSYLATTARHGLVLRWRAASDADMNHNNDLIPHEALKLPILLRLTRRGNTITAEYSRDEGRSFQPAGQPLTFDPPLAPTVYAGLAITSHDESQISEAKFRDLRIEPLRP